MNDPLEGLPAEIESVRFDANGLEIHALAAGPHDGPLVLLLHGFPELSRSWRHQLSALARAGYRAVAPDQRGYGRTTRRGPYDIETLSADVAAMLNALGAEQAVIVGHDWGGGVAWAFAGLYPHRVRALVIANCPPPQIARAFVAPQSQPTSEVLVHALLPVAGVARAHTHRGRFKGSGKGARWRVLYQNGIRRSRIADLPGCFQ